MDVASFLIAKENEPVEEAASSSTVSLVFLFASLPKYLLLKYGCELTHFKTS